MRDYPVPETAAGSAVGYAQAQLVGKNAKLHSPTLAENIDDRIRSMHDQIQRLERVRSLLREGRMLDIPIEDLRFAMNY